MNYSSVAEAVDATRAEIQASIAARRVSSCRINQLAGRLAAELKVARQALLLEEVREHYSLPAQRNQIESC